MADAMQFGICILKQCNVFKCNDIPALDEKMEMDLSQSSTDVKPQISNLS